MKNLYEYLSRGSDQYRYLSRNGDTKFLNCKDKLWIRATSGTVKLEGEVFASKNGTDWNLVENLNINSGERYFLRKADHPVNFNGGKFEVGGLLSDFTRSRETIENNPIEREFAGLFYKSGVVSAKTLVLPIDMDVESCARLFKDCEFLIDSPIMPATKLVKGCYDSMFQNCTSLTQAPELPASVLSDFCYGGMFNGCTSLTQAPKLNALVLARNCYQGMFHGCTKLKQAPRLPAKTLVKSCYSSMFEGCISLTQAPDLPATTLAESCYENMFYSCTSLTQAPALPATTLAESCYSRMFVDCTSLTQAPALPATKLAENCYSRIFMGCTELTRVELSFDKIPIGACSQMFVDCYNLSEIKISINKWPSSRNRTDFWVRDVAINGVFIKPKGVDIPFGEDGIPEDWEVQEF